MKRRSFIAAAILSSCWLLSGCPQASQFMGGAGSGAGDVPAAEVPQGQEIVDNAEPIEPKNDPKAIGGGTSTGGSVETEPNEEVKITGEMLKNGPLEVKPFVDARLRYGTDAKILAKSPAASYVIRAKSATIAPSFSVELTWIPP